MSLHTPLNPSKSIAESSRAGQLGHPARATAPAGSVAAAPRRAGQWTGVPIPMTKRSFGFLKADQSVDFAALDFRVASSEAHVVLCTVPLHSLEYHF